MVDSGRKRKKGGDGTTSIPTPVNGGDPVFDIPAETPGKGVRKAGSDDFQKKLSNAATQHAEERAAHRDKIAASPKRTEKRLSGLNRDAFDFSGYSDADIVRAYQGSTFDKNDYARLTGNPLDDGGSGGGNDEGGSGGGDNGGGKDDGHGTVSIPTPVDGGTPIFDPPSEPPRGYPEMPSGTGNFIVGGDLTQSIGNSGDQTTTIGDGNTFGDNTNIGNNNSTTIGVQNAGNASNASLNLQKQARGKAAAYLQFS